MGEAADTSVKCVQGAESSLKRPWNPYMGTPILSVIQCMASTISHG